jgi:hypothetical protein
MHPPPDAAHRPASGAERCRPLAAPRVRSVNGPRAVERLGALNADPRRFAERIEPSL